MESGNVPHALKAVERLVVFAPNWLGDAVMALPAIADVRRSAPRALLAVAARPSVAPLFALVPGVDRSLAIAPGRGRAKLLAENRFDLALLLPNSLQSAVTAWRAGIPARWGYRTDCRGPLLTRSVARVSGVHQAQYYQHLVRELGIPNGPLEPRLELPEAAREAAARLLAEAGWDGRTPLVALAPGAAYGGAKRWPPASFAALARGLADEGVTTMLVGTAADRPAGDEVWAEMIARGAPVPLDVIGRTDLPALAGVLGRCRALVTNDSGAMHLAAALGVPVTALFGPTDEQATAPLGAAPRTILIHDVWCRPCMLRECPIDHRCMRGIRPEAALEAARRAL